MTTQQITKQHQTIEMRIQGTKNSRIFKEFITSSALFPILDAIRLITINGLFDYLSETAHYVIIGAAFVQAWFLGQQTNATAATRFWGNLTGFGLYMAVELLLEGTKFFYEPYHAVFGIFSLLMAIYSGLQCKLETNPTIHKLIILLTNTTKLALFPVMYFITEIPMTPDMALDFNSLYNYFMTGAHQFLWFGILFYGLLLGLAEAQRSNYAAFLKKLALQLKEYSEWSLGSDLIAVALDNQDVLKMNRVKRTILFMDIRGFTAWSEQHTPQAVVEMLNQYYTLSETTIRQHGGHKPNFTADEVMTRFDTPQTAFDCAVALQQGLQPLLSQYDLAVGIGLNTGEVIEGLLGSNVTRKFDIIGDAVNTAKRLESAAEAHKIMLSEETYRLLQTSSLYVQPHTLNVKGKRDALTAFSFSE